ncbi:hypothetical protein HBZS_113250 [Helicobacter bizzozeronii CCUG 35545]|nr:hypothetical protein HBZS_113250 [Helicobacter bizzozeronii CCUG 35545]
MPQPTLKKIHDKFAIVCVFKLTNGYLSPRKRYFVPLKKTYIANFART